MPGGGAPQPRDYDPDLARALEESRKQYLQKKQVEKDALLARKLEEQEKQVASGGGGGAAAWEDKTLNREKAANEAIVAFKQKNPRATPEQMQGFMVETFRKFFPNIQEEELFAKIMGQFSNELDREHREVTKQFIKNVQIEALWNQRRIAIKTLGGGDCFYYALAQQLIETNNSKFKMLPHTMFIKVSEATEKYQADNKIRFQGPERLEFFNMMKVRYDLYDWVTNNWTMYHNGGRTLKEFFSFDERNRYFSEICIKNQEDAEKMLWNIGKQGIDAEFSYLQFAADKYCCDIDFAVCTNGTVEPGKEGWKEPALGHGTIKSYEPQPFEVPKIGIALYNVGRHRHFVAMVSVDGAWSLQNQSQAVNDAYSKMGYGSGTGTATENFRNLLSFLKDTKQYAFFQEFANKFLEEQKKPETPSTNPELAASFIDRTLMVF